jgi:hypothetical protein
VRRSSAARVAQRGKLAIGADRIMVQENETPRTGPRPVPDGLVDARVTPQPTRDAYSSAVYCEHVDVDGDHKAREPVPRAVAVLAADDGS